MTFINETGAAGDHAAVPPSADAAMVVLQGSQPKVVSMVELERFVRDAIEAYDAAEELFANTGHRADATVAIDKAGREDAVRIVREAGIKLGDKSVDRTLFERWTDEHVERYGARPNARSVRRWCRIHLDHGVVPARPFGPRSKASTERVWQDLKAFYRRIGRPSDEYHGSRRRRRKFLPETAAVNAVAIKQRPEAPNLN